MDACLIENFWIYTFKVPIQSVSSICVHVKLIIFLQASDGSLVRRSAASMLSGKKHVQAAVSILFLVYSVLCVLG